MEHVGTALIDPHHVFDQVGLQPGMRVADFGCGRTGHFIFSAARLVGEKGIVYAVEVVKDILESIKSRVRSEGYDNIETVWSDIELIGKTPIPKESLDVCFLVNVMFMLKDPRGAFFEAERLLKSGGSVVVVDWRRQMGPLGPTAERMISREKLDDAANGSSLEFVKEFSVGDYHQCFIFKKKS